jgi:hypothetical protein
MLVAGTSYFLLERRRATEPESPLVAERVGA